MTRTATVVVWLIVLLLAAPAHAQDARGTVAKWYLSTVKTGHEMQWEQAMKEHVDWHRQQNDTWTWHTYMIVSGERLGQYITMTTDHAWADFDTPDVAEQEDAADASSRLGPHIESLGSGLWDELPDLSRPPDASPPFPLIQIINYGIKPSKGAVFAGNVVQFGQTVDATNMSFSVLWFVRPDGGAAARTFTRIVPRENWASMQPNPGAKTSFEAVAETFGSAGLQQWIDSFGESVEWLKSEFWQYRPDLSHVP